MRGSGEQQRETIRPEFNPAILIDFQDAKITSDTGFLLLREIEVSVPQFRFQAVPVTGESEQRMKSVLPKMHIK